MDVEIIESEVERPNFICNLGLLSRPDGSALFTEGKTVVLAAIYGPVEARMQRLLADRAIVECIYKPKAGFPCVQDRYKESFIKNICEISLAVSLYPRSAVLVNIQEMQNQGQLLSCAINAVCLACLDSGIDMKFLFGAVSCFFTKEGILSLVPPINESSNKGMFLFVFNNTNGDIIATRTEGVYTIEQYQEALTICRNEVKKVFIFYKKALLATK